MTRYSPEVPVLPKLSLVSGHDATAAVAAQAVKLLTSENHVRGYSWVSTQGVLDNVSSIGKQETIIDTENIKWGTFPILFVFVKNSQFLPPPYSNMAANFIFNMTIPSFYDVFDSTHVFSLLFMFTRYFINRMVLILTLHYVKV